MKDEKKTLIYVEPFKYLKDDIVPIRSKSRRYNSEDIKFIEKEIKRLLDNNIIRRSDSCWRSQVLVANRKIKPRLVIDYSDGINKFTELSGYPSPHIETLINEIAMYSWFTKIDLKQAYHQLCLYEKDKHFTGFEALGRLYEFNKLPFGLTNGCALLQQFIDGLIDKYKLKGVYAYMDDITICGLNEREHDLNLNRFMKALKEQNVVINDEKSDYKKVLKC